VGIALDSFIIGGFPAIFGEFRERPFSLLWRRRCLGQDKGRRMFENFTPVKENSNAPWKADPSLKSFLFTLRICPISLRKQFALKVEEREHLFVIPRTVPPLPVAM
jgi:hypothetical protein